MIPPYIFKFDPIYKERIWGGQRIRTRLGKDTGSILNCGESWELSAVEGNVSVVANGELKGRDLNQLIQSYGPELLGGTVWNDHGGEFPLLVKFIDANLDLSIQVHPGDRLASERHGGKGKSEMWYVLDAEENSFIYNGFRKGVNKDDFVGSIADENITGILNTEQVNNGDVFYIPAGRIHSIGGGILLAEIQQTSDITYRVFDFNREGPDGKQRELHVDLASDALDFSPVSEFRNDYETVLNEQSLLVDSPYFHTSLIHSDTTCRFDYSRVDSFVIYMCTEGSGSISAGSHTEALTLGDTFLVPASFDEVTIIPEGQISLLEVFVPESK